MSTLISAPAQFDLQALQDFRTSLRGQLIKPEDSEYGDARLVRNGLIDRFPALVARVAGNADVVAAINFARDHNLLCRSAAAATMSPEAL
ncbi:hypothetical protein BH24CHL4_BH24CHL4_23930 [soil metagenome]